MARPFKFRRGRTSAGEPRRCAGVVLSLRRSAGSLLAAALTALAAAPAGAAGSYSLAPHKDELFAYQNVLKSEYGGDFLLVDYDRPRDLYSRDAVKLEKVKPEYVDLATEAAETDLALTVGGRKVVYTAVGRFDGNAKAIVIFLHGRGTNRQSGASDWIHGGNFNRVKNLMMRNDGLYISADFSDFGRRGTAEIKALLLHEAELSPGAPVFLACGSWGGKICWRLIYDADTAPLIKGMMLLDSVVDDAFIAQAARMDPAARPAIGISASMEDWVVGYRSQVAFFEKMKSAVPDYPIRFVLFDEGTHGISLRMTDWRQVLNWMLAAKGY